MGARPFVTVKRASSATLGGSTHSKGGANNNRVRALRRCHKCNDNFKPGRAHHDSVTGRCIVKFDHFCPWVGNAVVSSAGTGTCLSFFVINSNHVSVLFI